MWGSELWKASAVANTPLTCVDAIVRLSYNSLRMTLAATTRVPLSAATRVYLATLAAYLPAAFIAPVSGSILGGLDASALVVPFCAAFAVAFPFWGRAADRHPAGKVLAISLAAVA